MKDDPPQVPLTASAYENQPSESGKERPSSQLGEVTEDWADEVARLAHAYWEADGRVDGRDLDHWLTAEQDVMRRHGKEAK